MNDFDPSDHLIYNKDTGDLRWLPGPGRRKSRVGTVTGCQDNFGYLRISLFGRPRLAHVLAWRIYYGRWPKGNIDHVNGDTSDNRICNLREATQSQNMANQGIRSDNTSGYKGVHFERSRGKWIAYIQVGKKSKTLGRFDDREEAAKAYNKAAIKYFGEFAKINDLGKPEPEAVGAYL